MATRGRKTLSAIWALARCDQPVATDADGKHVHLTSAHRHLWLLYRSYEGKGGRGAYPGDELLASMMGRTERMIRKYRAELLEWGFLRQQLRGPAPALYWAVLPAWLEETLPVDLRSDDDVDADTPAKEPDISDVYRWLNKHPREKQNILLAAESAAETGKAEVNAEVVRLARRYMAEEARRAA